MADWTRSEYADPASGRVIAIPRQIMAKSKENEKLLRQSFVGGSERYTRVAGGNGWLPWRSSQPAAWRAMWDATHRPAVRVQERQERQVVARGFGVNEAARSAVEPPEYTSRFRTPGKLDLLG